MEFRVLGPLALARAGRTSALPGTLRRRLLAALLVRHNTVVPADRLANILWGDDGSRSTARNLHNQVWRLRAALDECAPGAARALLTQPPGYLLRVEPDAIDAVRFERAVDEARRHADRPELAAGLLTEALGLWRGPAYAEFAGEEFCRYEAMRLEELRLVATEERFEASLAMGRHAELIGAIEAFTVEHPLRERPRGQLMSALHRSGRSADAVAIYRQFRQHLIEQLGMEPSPALSLRHQHILRGEPDPDPDRTGAVARPPAPGNLRAELGEPFGRAAEIALARHTLSRHRVVTMTGVGGVGKTRLAVRVATEARASFPDGVWVCELAAVRDGWLVPDVIATTLGVQQPQGRGVLDGLVDFLRSRQVLLVIDNCEHVLDDAARLVDTLVHGCPRLTVLATSREPLGVEGEHVRPVRPLTVPPRDADLDPDRLAAVPSVALFLDRAEAANAEFAIGEHNAAEVAEICRRLDGLPLAIELAATRLASLSVAEIADRLERRLEFLHSTRRIREDRHSTLGAVVDWSYNLLEPHERAVFDRLSVLVGTFTMADATAIASGPDLGPAEVAELVAGLVHKSMLVADTDRTRARYTMLETLRIYGRERLARTGRTDSLRRRHTAHCVAVAEASTAGLVGPDEARFADRIAGLLDDLRGAHSWALANEPATAVRISAALLRYTTAHGPSEVYAWADRAAAAVPGTPPDPLLALTLAVAAAGAARRGDLAGAADLARRGLRMVPQRTDPWRRFPLWVLARVASFEGRLTDAAHLYAAVAKHAEQVGDTHCVAYVTASAALQDAYQGAGAVAVPLAAKARDLALSTANPTAIAWAEYAMGVVWQDDDPNRALSHLERAFATGRAGANTYIPGVALSVAAGLMARHGDPRQAARLAAEVVGYWSGESHWAQQWVALRNVIGLLARLGEDEPAAAIHGALLASKAAIPPVGSEAERLEASVAMVARRLGPARFGAATARGAAMDDDDAVAYAGSVLARINGAASAEPPAPGAFWNR